MAKGRMKTLLEKMPIFIVDQDVGILGAEEFVVRHIK